MVELFKQVLTCQFEAALWMLQDALGECPSQHWDGLIARYPFWTVAYHTLIFTDLYLAPSEDEFKFRAIHPGGWREFNDEFPTRRFERPELLEYCVVVRDAARRALAVETEQTLPAPARFPRRIFSRAELYLYNLRHVQHHTGQLHAFLRRIDPQFQARSKLLWRGTAAGQGS